MPLTPSRAAPADDPSREPASAPVWRAHSAHGATPAETGRWSARDLAVLGGIVVLALALRIPGLNESLVFDELWSTGVKLGTVESLVRTVAVDVHPPLYLVLMFGWIRLFGDSELSVRMIPLLSGLATVALTAPLTRAYGGRVAGLVAALLLALSPVHIWYSQEARHYSFLLLVLVTSVLVFHRIRAASDWRWYAVYAALAMCLVFTHYFAIAYLGAMVLLVLHDRRRRWPMVASAGSAAGALAIFLALKAWRWGLPTSAGSLREFELVDFWRLPLEWFLTGGAFGAPGSRAPITSAVLVTGQVLFLALMVRGLHRAGARPSVSSDDGRDGNVARLELPLLLTIVPLGLAALGVMGARQYYNDRSALGALPFFLAAVATGVATLRPSPRRVATTMILAFGGAVLAGYFARQDERTVDKPKPDWRAIARDLAADHERTGAPVIVASMSPALELNYYASFGLVYYSSGTVIPDVGGRAGRVYVLERPDVGLIREILARERASVLYLARNAYWLGSDPPNYVIRATDDLIRAVSADTSFVVEPAAEAKGVRLLRVRSADSAISR